MAQWSLDFSKRSTRLRRKLRRGKRSPSRRSERDGGTSNVEFRKWIGHRIKVVEGFPYREFIVPGLIVMAMVQAAYSNNSSSVFQARSDRYIHDVLSAPMRNWQMNLGFNVGGVLRSIAIGVGSAPTSIVVRVGFGLPGPAKNSA